MSREDLKKHLIEGKKILVRWVKSGIIEVAFLTRKNDVMIQNLISRKQYHIPKRYNE